MRAAQATAYGPPTVVRVSDVPEPVFGPSDILVRIVASTVSTADARVRGLVMPRGFGLLARPTFGRTRPRRPILGADFAGVVEDRGRDVTAFARGDRVFGTAGLAFGCHAEKRALPATGAVLPLPEAVSFEQGAALCFGGTTALHFLRTRARLRGGERVLVVGASGVVGSAVVQIARILGATVDGVAGPGKADFLRSLGCVRVFDHADGGLHHAPFPYDVIVECAGVGDLSAYAPLLAPSGRLCLVTADLPQMMASAWGALRSKRQALFGPATEARNDLRDLADWCAAGTFIPLVDSVFPLADAAAAHARVDSGRRKGNVILRMDR